MYTAPPDGYSALDVLGYRSAPYSRLDVNNSYPNSEAQWGVMGIWDIWVRNYRDTGY